MKSQITVKLIKSTIKKNEKIKATVKGLGLRKTNDEKTLPNDPRIRGMIKKVLHLLEVKE